MQNTYLKNKFILETLAKYEPRSMHNNLPVIWSKAKDSFVWDINGKKYIDFTSGICVANAGHNNPKIVKAVRNAHLYHSYSFPTEVRAKYVKALCEITGFDKVFLVSSGTEAVETACKIMRYKKENLRIILSFKGSMHGKTFFSEALKGNEQCSYVYNLRYPIPEQHWQDIIKNVNTTFIDNACGIMIESYRGWDADFFSPFFIQELYSWAKERGILVCFDEIQSGFGRTGKMFAYEHYGIPRPDLICVGKGMTSSVPMSGVLGRKELLDLPDDLSSTHSANPLCCAAGLANLQEIKRILPDIRTKEGLLFNFLNKNFSYILTNGRGLVAALLTPNAEFATEVCYKAMEKGLLLIKTDKPSIKIAPPLTISEDVLLKGLNILKECL